MPGTFGDLTIQADGGATRTHPLEKALNSMGRYSANDIRLDAEGVSRKHAELRIEGERALLIDTGTNNRGSTGGTFVGQRKLVPMQPEEIHNGGSFRIGPYTLTYRAANAPKESATPAALQPSPKPPLPPPPRQPPASLPPVQPPRPTFTAPLPLNVASAYLNYLPDFFQDAHFLGRFLRLFEAIWEPIEYRQDHLAFYFDPRTCPTTFIPWLARWLGITINPFWAEARQRDLLVDAMELYRWRGTTDGLASMIKTCTGIDVTIVASQADPFEIEISAQLPKDGSVSREQIEELIVAHKPAHVGYRLTFR